MKTLIYLLIVLISSAIGKESSDKKSSECSYNEPECTGVESCFLPVIEQKKVYTPFSCEEGQLS
ncbi:hypothetical protein E7Z59_09705 [Robertkochia marina]|uniref:Uncharacterized protein n=1 Tax=Robertkochia marina TaxID=1227945 RepID=A0A4S3M0J6_9FLAO|nr:hypothetical protein [Robertkochia marina]THD67914.1 hypothetical protein E7Z59_09705 [Robertkochia marina]TRZ41021.1 hypothetical protein D3A96_14250 [Robertkochia marina]